MEKLTLQYMDCDSFVLSNETPNLLNAMKNIEDFFDSSNLDENHEIFSNKNKKVVGKLKIGTRENVWIDEFICLRSKAYSLKCGNKNKNRLKVVSNSYPKYFEFDEYKNA